ncbi:MAG TPA: YceI family protein [Lacipirellulaceae bacterium]|jgi:polyisoprenoid-binding protein YceI|nr:YceI family protein [Lacipirellulaceae bacterium]
MTARTTYAIFVFMSCLWSAPVAALAAEAYTIDPAHTSVVFSVGHTGLSYTYGVFRQAGGGYILDKTNPANCQFEFAIQTESIDTNHAERDKHLRSTDFLNTQQFPTITFESTSCALGNAPAGSIVYNVTGNLTIHGVTRQVTLPLRMLGEGKGPFGDERTGFLCQVELKRSDYGMRSLLDMVGDAVGITISFEGSMRQATGQTAPPPLR